MRSLIHLDKSEPVHWANWPCEGGTNLLISPFGCLLLPEDIGHLVVPLGMLLAQLYHRMYTWPRDFYDLKHAVNHKRWSLALGISNMLPRLLSRERLSEEFKSSDALEVF